MSLWIALPVILWAVSGIMHPLMTTIRPDIATQVLEDTPIDSVEVKKDFSRVLLQNDISSFKNFRLARIGGQVFYQVQLGSGQKPRYFSTVSGAELADGDELYARDLARYFLLGKTNSTQTKEGNDTTTRTEVTPGASGPDTQVDACCQIATKGAMNCTSGSHVSSISYLDAFDGEYKYVNRLLPVYRINYQREDGLRIYVQTESGKFAYAVDNKRAGFDQTFAWLHTYSWLDSLGMWKEWVISSVSFVGFITALIGLYIFFAAPNPKGKTPILKSRRLHRYTALVFSVFTLMFTFSGAYHAFSKTKTEKRDFTIFEKDFSPQEVSFRLDSLFSKFASTQITNLHLAPMDDINSLQVSLKLPSKGLEPEQKDMMKSSYSAATKTIYADPVSLDVQKLDDVDYAQFLASKVSGLGKKLISESKAITRFEGEYGFVNKRLPVHKIEFATDNHERCYVETTTGILSTRVTDQDVWEGLSFSMLHKHHFLDFGGKKLRDFSTMFAALSQIIVVLLGLVLWLKLKRLKS